MRKSRCDTLCIRVVHLNKYLRNVVYIPVLCILTEILRLILYLRDSPPIIQHNSS